MSLGLVSTPAAIRMLVSRMAKPEAVASYTSYDLMKPMCHEAIGTIRQLMKFKVHSTGNFD